MSTLVTGCAGFVGYHLAEALLSGGGEVVGVDVVSDYYDPALKEARLARLARHAGFSFHRFDLADGARLAGLFAARRPHRVAHLAAQAGVRHSLVDPGAYTRSNIEGFLSVLEACRAHPVQHLVFASTSSVYGASWELPFREAGVADHPLSLYAATKKANEAMAHSYAHLFGTPSTGVRLFTVYGPWGRPDMALFIFTRAILEGRPIPLFNAGDMSRDFTYIDDVVRALVRLLDLPPAVDAEWDARTPDPASSGAAPYRLLNVGRGRTEPLMRYIHVLEEKLGRKAQIEALPMQDGDVPVTWADTSRLEALTGLAPSVDIETGVARFVDWYLGYYDQPGSR